MAITATQPTTERLVVDWEGYLNLPDDLTHYEIIDGEVIPLASPTLKHQRFTGTVQATYDDIRAIRCNYDSGRCFHCAL
jgi:Uma2 family endonuclease